MEKALERRPWLVPLILAALTVIVLRPVIIPTGVGHILNGKDLPQMFYLLQGYIRQTLQDGELPLWIPHQFIGLPLIGNPHAGFFYPGMWAVWLIGETRGIGLMMALHVWLGAWGMARLARSFGASRTGALLGGVVYATSGWAAAQFFSGHFNHVMVFGWVPWGLVAYRHALARESFGDDIDIIVHCHDELDLPSAVRVARAVEPIDPLYYEDPLDIPYSDNWLALRRATRLAIMTGENLYGPEQVLPFLTNQAVDVLQPDLVNAGGITGCKKMVDVAEAYRTPITLHNVSSWALGQASQQFAAAIFNCPMIECLREADQVAEAASNTPIIKDGKQKVSMLPGLGIDFDMEYMRAHMAEGEPWWGDE